MKKITLIFLFGYFLSFTSGFCQYSNFSKYRIDSLFTEINIAVNSNKYEEAILIGKEALIIFDEKGITPDTLMSNFYCVLGNVYIDLGRYDEAKNFYDKCLALRIDILGEDNFKVIEAYFNLGLYFDYTNQLELAISYYNKSVDYCLSNLPLRREHLAKTYYNMGVCYAFLEDYEKSLKLNQKALEIDISIYGKDHEEIAYDLNSIGILYFYLNDLDKALLSYLESKRILEKNKLGEEEIVAGLEMNIGSLFEKKGEYEKSISHLNNSLQIFRKIFSNSHYRVIDNLWILGKVYLTQGNPKEALQHLNLAQSLAETNSNITWEARKDILYHLSNTHRYLGQPQKANQLVQEAMAIVFPDTAQVAKSNNGFKLKAWANLQVLQAAIFLEQYKKEPKVDLLKQADLNYQEALAFWQKKRQQFHGDLSKETWLEKHYQTFEKAIECKLLLAEANGQEKYLQQAYTLAEESRALLLLDALQKTKAANYTGLPDSLLQQEKNLNKAIAEIDQSIFSAEEEEEGLDSQLVRLNGELFALQSTYDTLLQIMKQKYPDYYQLRHQRKTTSVAEIQNQLLTGRQGVLQYFKGDSSLFVFVIQKDTFQVHQVALDFPLNQWVSEWRQSVEAYGNGRREAASGEQYVQSSRKLYDRLIAPFAENLPPEITIVADGALGYLPFEALLATTPEQVGAYRSYDYFLHHHTISYAFSTSWWKEILEKKNRTNAPNAMLAMAPEFGARPIAQGTRSAGLSALQHNQEEAQSIAQLWGGLALTAAEATKENFIKQAGQYQILHLATHAKANDLSGDYSFLAFTGIPDAVDQENLYARELYELSLNADLVVLSACETGVGEMQRGEGIISLARGFSYAGARSLLTTLWRVSDDKAARLMKDFYKELSQQTRKDLALQNSKINYLTNCRDREAHPFYWAAFVGMGNMESLERPSSWSKWAWGILGFLILGLGVWYGKKRQILNRGTSKKELYF